MKVILFFVIIPMYVLANMVAPGKVGSLGDFFRQPCNEFQLEDLTMIGTTFDFWVSNALDTLVDQAGMDQDTRKKVLPGAKMRFSAKY